MLAVGQKHHPQSRGLLWPMQLGLQPPSSRLDPMSRLFGTDGVRGLANGLLTAELAMNLAQAAAVVLGRAPAVGTAPVSLPGFFNRGDGIKREAGVSR